MQKTMLAAASIAVVSPTAMAQYNQNDLILGFTKSGAQSDYIIDFGNANSVVGVGGTSVQDLSSHVSSSTFNATFGGLNGVNMGVVGGNSAFAGRDLYYTILRNAVGTPSVPGSTPAPPLAASPMGSGVGDIASLAIGLSLSPGHDTTVAQGAGNSWSSVISPGTAPPSFTVDTGIDPMGQASGTIIYEDLYGATPNTAFTYLGYFTFDTTSQTTLTFTPAGLAVPEPSTLGILAVGGVLMLLVRRRRANAVTLSK